MSVRTGGKYGTVDNVRLWEEWREVGGSLRGGESVVALIYISRTGDASACGSQIGGLLGVSGQRAAGSTALASLARQPRVGGAALCIILTGFFDTLQPHCTPILDNSCVLPV